MPGPVSVIIVNYNSAHLLESCLASMRHSLHEIIVIDNASSSEDRQRLCDLASGRVRIVLNDRNAGFSAACNQGARLSSGDYLFFLNPDTIVFGDAVGILAAYLERNPGTAAAGPRIWWDTEKTIQLPPSRLPSPLYEAKAYCAGISLFHQWISYRSAGIDFRFWMAVKPFDVEMLSGAALMVSRDAFERTGGFDEEFPLYCEDSDWCLRAVNNGCRLVTIPEAEICHLYNQSAKQNSRQSAEKYSLSIAHYRRKHHSLPVIRLLGAFRRIATGMADFFPCSPPEDLGLVTLPPRFAVNRKTKGPALFQFSVFPAFLPAAGMVFENPELSFPVGIWENLSPGRYYARFVDMDDGKVISAWQFVKG